MYFFEMHKITQLKNNHFSKNLKGLNPSVITQLFPFWFKKRDTIKDYKDIREMKYQK